MMRQTGSVRPRLAAALLLVWLAALWQSPALAADLAVTIGTGAGQTPAAVAIDWDDAWFAQDAMAYRQELALSSMALSGAAYVGEGESVRDALQALGFEKIEAYHYQPDGETGDQAACTFGVKRVKNQAGKTVPLVAVVIRGTGDYTEWASNLDVGAQGDHEGFAGARDAIQKSLEKYLKKAGVTQGEKDLTKFLITGHSRGAAVANLLAARLPDAGWARKENVYAYTFAAPAVSTNGAEEGYENIFNIVNADDLVTQVPLAAWGYHRYGVDLTLPTGREDLFAEMNKQYRALTSQDYTGYHDPAAVEKMTGALYRLIPSTSGVNMEMFASLLGGDFEGLSGLVRQNGLAALLMGKAAMEASSQLTPLIQNEQGALRSAHCMAGYYSWLSVSEGFLTESLEAEGGAPA